MMERCNSNRILVVEDEASLRLVLVDLLKGRGYAIDTVDTGKNVKGRIVTTNFDLVILDIMLPDMDGFDVCRGLRDEGISIPVLMLTARDQTSDKIRGLRIGADDYLTKPFDPEELLARIEVLLRRTPRMATEDLYDFGEIHVNLKKGIVYRGWERVALSEREFALLRYLIERAGKVVTREELLVDVWKYAPVATTRTIDMHISQLRRKLERNPKSPSLIVTVQHQGYRFLG